MELLWHSRPLAGHDLLMGAGFRASRDRMQNGRVLHFDPESGIQRLSSLFLQDDIALLPTQLTLTLGSKFEYNDLTGMEIQPNLRLLWQPHPQHNFWASVARAVALPPRMYRDAVVYPDVDVNGLGIFPEHLPYHVTPMIFSSDGIDAEHLLAYELGYRGRLRPGLELDLALYFHDYDALWGFHTEAPICANGAGFPGCLFNPAFDGRLLVPAEMVNRGEGRAYGMELAVDWRLDRQWRAQLAGQVQRIEIDSPADVVSSYPEGMGSNPKWQASLRLSYNPRRDWDVDLWLRHVGELEGFFTAPDRSVDAYSELDLRLAWRPRDDLECSLVGRHLLHRRHVEFFSDLAYLPEVALEPSWFAKVEWRF